MNQSLRLVYSHISLAAPYGGQRKLPEVGRPFEKPYELAAFTLLFHSKTPKVSMELTFRVPVPKQSGRHELSRDERLRI